MHAEIFEGAGVPRAQDIRRRLRKGEGIEHGARRLFGDRVRGAVFRIVRHKTVGYPPGKTGPREPSA